MNACYDSCSDLHDKTNWMVLPKEMIMEVLEFCNMIDVIIITSKVCKNWRNLSFSLVSNKNSDLTKNFQLDMTRERDRNKLVAYLIRKEVYNIAIHAHNYSQHKQTTIEHERLLTEIQAGLSQLEIYLSHFHDLKKRINTETKPSPSNMTINEESRGFFSRFISNILTTTEVSATEPVNPIVKIMLKGTPSSGKTSFLKCCINRRPVDGVIRNSISMDYGTRSMELGSDLKMTAQLWDEHRHYTYSKPLSYSNVFAIILTLDPFSIKSANEFASIVDQVMDSVSSRDMIEIITVQTKKDRFPLSARKVSEVEFQRLAFKHFGGGLAVNITNTIIDEPDIVMWYCTLLNYVMIPKKE